MSQGFPKLFAPTTPVVESRNWSNYHGTVKVPSVPCYALLDAEVGTADAGTRSAVRQARALGAILDLCFKAQPPEPLRPMGARWSLSNIIAPKNVVVDAGTMTAMSRVDASHLTVAYAARVAPTGAVPVIVGGGAHIFDVNTTLGRAGLALQTSGAGNGHRIAGCIATGTHGSAIGIGAVHDTVRALYLLVGPNEGVLLQPATQAPFNPSLAQWFQDLTEIPTTLRSDDEMFAAAVVSLGSLGFVHSVIVETVPLYRLEGRMRPRPAFDPTVFKAIETMDTTPLHPDRAERPYHFSLLVDPYAKAGEIGLYPTLLWKVPRGSVPFEGPLPTLPMASTDLTRLLGTLIPLVDGPIAGPLIEHIVSTTLRAQNPPADFPPMFPGQVFGFTSLPAGHGRSTEIVVNQKVAVVALSRLLTAIEAERQKGRHLLGAIGVRFVPKTQALLGMNVHAMNCYVEIPGIANADVVAIHRACWKALDDGGIAYTCHWGQEHALDAAHLKAYFGDRVDRWKQARAKLLPTATARAVFAAPPLKALGLDG